MDDIDPETLRLGVMSLVVERLEDLARVHREASAQAAFSWLQENAAGYPMVPLLEERARFEAQFWAETASPAELECYALAAVDRLVNVNALFATRQIKRLIAGAWRRMTPDQRDAFLAWVQKEEKDHERG